MLIASQLFAHVDQTIGGPADPSLGGSIALVNAAGRHLMTMYPWSSAGRASVLLSTTANQSYIDLPADFGALEAINATNNLDRRVRLTTLGQILALRTSLLTVGAWSYSAAINWRQTSTSAIVPVLELWPTPATVQTDVITLMYTARWVDLSADNSPVLVPAFLEPLLIQVVRAFGRGYEFEAQATLEDRLSAVERGPIMAAAIRFDSSSQGNLGQMHGSQIEEHLVDSNWGLDQFTLNAP